MRVFEYLSVAKETEFDFWGFVFVMLAAVMSGFRWSMTQILLQVLSVPVSLAYFLLYFLLMRSIIFQI